MSSPWKKIATPEPTNFQDIVSEELTKKLIESCLKEIDPQVPTKSLNEKENIVYSTPSSSGTNTSHLDFCDDGEKEGFDDMTQEDLDEFNKINDLYDTPVYGHTSTNTKIKSKSHESSRYKNTTYDNDSNMRELTYRHYIYTKAVPKCPPKWRKHYDRDLIITGAMKVANFNEETTMLLHKLIDKRFLERVNYTISADENGILLHVFMGANFDGPKECVMKVFKPKSAEEFASKQSKNKASQIHLDDEKKICYLQKLTEANIPCSQIVYDKNNILITTFIGSEYEVAPKLKYVFLNNKENVIAYNQVVKYMNLLYRKCDLIYPNLTAKEILWYKSDCYFADVSKMIEPSHKNALSFLYRSCQNISTFFKKRNVPNVATADKMFENITGFDYKDKFTLGNDGTATD